MDQQTNVAKEKSCQNDSDIARRSRSEMNNASRIVCSQACSKNRNDRDDHDQNVRYRVTNNDKHGNDDVANSCR